jgi:hypothetical protein
MNRFSRRKLLQIVGQASAGLGAAALTAHLPLQEALAAAAGAQDEFFILITPRAAGT